MIDADVNSQSAHGAAAQSPTFSVKGVL